MSLFWWSPATAAAAAAAGYEQETPSGVLTLTAPAPTLETGDLEAPSGVLTLTGVAPTLETADLSPPSGVLTLVAPVPGLQTSESVDEEAPSGVLTLVATAPTLETADLSPPSGVFTLVAPVPLLDLEGIQWVTATATAPRDLASVALAGAIDWEGDTVVARCYGAACDFDSVADLYADELNDELPTGGGYTSGGIALAGKSKVVVGTHTRLLSDDVEVPSATFSVAFIAIIDTQSGADATSPIVGLYDLDGLKQAVGEPFVVSPDVDGWLYGIST